MAEASFPLEPQAPQPGGPAPFARLPDLGSLFSRRANRFDQLALSRTPKDFFLFLSALAHAQDSAARGLDLLNAAAVYAADHAAGNTPPLAAAKVRLDRSWHDVFGTILSELACASLPAQTGAAIRRGRELDGRVAEAWAHAILRGVYQPVDPAVAPLIAAALQVYWAKLASLCELELISSDSPSGNCPACGSPPVSAVISADPASRGNRYLCCSLCATQWRLARIKCSNCESFEGISYYGVDGADQALRAETCDQCKVYLKTLYFEKDPQLDPVADDTGSIALDILLGEAGWHRVTPVSFIFTPD